MDGEHCHFQQDIYFVYILHFCKIFTPFIFTLNSITKK